jgi:acyl carrier protein
MGEITEGGTPGIGRPLGNMQVYVLDGNGEPVPLGMSGELYIGGAGIGRGYVGRPDLTAERFVPDHCSGRAGERLYRSGDRVKRRADGTLEFLGRTDEQVKIRGMRVELGEIEATLKRHPGVREAVVIAREEEKGDKRLIGYVTATVEQASPGVMELREHVRRSLPEHMVPNAFVVLEKFPMTANGKLDRRSLPVPEKERPELESGYVAPRTPVEETLAEIWRELLQVDRIGIHDNFFQLGGHSLLMTRLAWKITEVFLVEVPLAELFQALNIEEMTLLIAEYQLASTTSPAPQVLLQELSRLAMEEPERTTPPAEALRSSDMSTDGTLPLSRSRG